MKFMRPGLISIVMLSFLARYVFIQWVPADAGSGGFVHTVLTSVIIAGNMVYLPVAALFQVFGWGSRYGLFMADLFYALLLIVAIQFVPGRTSR
jgi:hypothetical protein